MQVDELHLYLNYLLKGTLVENGLKKSVILEFITKP